ncbi:hypothetical protein [Hymenobacter volaticus]|uniref:M50 family peptidase n=1 Tax=Hymenobacter volaticus TaxID=2932254 RepID=A0ABY4G7K2_9BACT|nr:hypothetical protein [Hymenobacter volaticus]UOQ66878.1 hypothetical protein MUN86_02890 [Hymenobacter volaticus]
MSTVVSPSVATPNNRLTLNATCVYIAAFLLTELLHELAHALMALALGGQPVLYNSSVRNLDSLSDSKQVLVALAGPIFSLLQGLVVLVFVRRSQATGPAALFALFFGAFGLINFLGYLMITPFVPYGDLGQVAAIWHLPMSLLLGVAVAAVIILTASIRRMAPLFMRFVPAEVATPATRAAKGRMLRALIAWPWLIGSVLITFLSWPLPTFASFLVAPMSSMVLGAAWGAAMRQPELPGSPAPAIFQWSWGR